MWFTIYFIFSFTSSGESITFAGDHTFNKKTFLRRRFFNIFNFTHEKDILISSRTIHSWLQAQERASFLQQAQPTDRGHVVGADGPVRVQSIQIWHLHKSVSLNDYYEVEVPADLKDG